MKKVPVSYNDSELHTEQGKKKYSPKNYHTPTEQEQKPGTVSVVLHL